MNEIKKLLKTVVNDQQTLKNQMIAVINGQHALKTELLGEISRLEKTMDKGFAAVDKRFVQVDKRFDEVNQRLDKQGKQFAYLEEDAPTREEHDNLEKRVEKIEQHLKN